MKTILQTLLLLLFTCSISWGQNANLIADLNPGSGDGATFEENTRIFFEGKIYFTANDGEHGFELMVYDGNSISLVKDINEGASDSDCQNFYILNNKLIFTADDGVHGTEFWVSDGTEAGTELLIDLDPGASGGVYTGFGESSTSFEIFDGELYFNGKDRPNDFEPWKTDGTPTGTSLIKNIGFDSGNFVSGSFPDDFTVFEGNLYFGSRDGFWKTDGTTNGTVLITDEDPDDPFGFDPSELLATNSTLYLLQNGNLWISDGTTSGTVMIKEFVGTQLNWSGPRMRDLGDFILFPSNDGITGDELWRSDGTTAGTELVIDLFPGSDGYAPQNTVVLDGKMYYKGESATSGIEFYVSDGTAAGTQLVKDFSGDGGSGFFLPSTIFTDGQNIYLSAGRAFNQELWVSDGTTEGTFEVEINPNGDAYPCNFLAFDDKVFFMATVSNTGREHYVYDILSNTVDLISNQLTLYPNPAQNVITFKGDLPLHYECEVVDNMGRKVRFTRDVSGGLVIEDLADGLYYISLKDTKSNKIESYRFVKQCQY